MLVTSYNLVYVITMYSKDAPNKEYLTLFLMNACLRQTSMPRIHIHITIRITFAAHPLQNWPPLESTAIEIKC